MAGDWIKMRGSLVTHPKVLKLAKIIATDPYVAQRLLVTSAETLDCVVTRDVTRDMVVASLLRVWCACNEHTSDGIWPGIELDDLDQVAGIPGFGAALSKVGWASIDPGSDRVIFPNFLEYNAPAKNGGRSAAAERQRRYRERKRQQNEIATGNGYVSSDVTRTPREEKRKISASPPTRAVTSSDPFAMDMSWLPGPEIKDRMSMAGIPPDRLTEERIGEFKSYWMTRSEKLTNNQWEHKLIQALQKHWRQPREKDHTVGRSNSRKDVHDAINDIDDKTWARGL